jgi:hypothetical protein
LRNCYLTVYHGEPEADPKTYLSNCDSAFNSYFESRLLRNTGFFLDDVLKSPVSGFLNDHYNPGSTATFAANGAIVPAPGNRNVQLGGEIRF